MAQGFGFCARNCLEWSVEKPFMDCPRESPTFSYLGSDWFLSLSLDEKYGYELSVKSKEEKVLTKMVTALIKTKRETLNSYDHCFYYYKSKCVLLHHKTKTNNEDYGRWTVYCIFPDELPCELHVQGSETEDLTTSPDSKGQLNSTQSSILMNAKLAASAPYDSQSSVNVLLSDFSKLLEDESSSDITLTCGDRTFFAHKTILTARSEVFKSMLRSGMVESKTNSIDITDIDAEVLDLLLKYVYAGKVSDLSVDIAPNLYMAADKYSIPSLKDECSKWMLGNLTKENCLVFLDLADASSDERFKERLINFVARILDLFERNEWMKFSDKYPKLANSVYEKRVFTKLV